VDLPYDGSDPFTDGRDRNIDGTDKRSTANMLQHISAAETIAAASPLPIPTGDPPLCIWHCGLIAAVVNTVVHNNPIDCRPENHFQYMQAGHLDQTMRG
jgi:hypothetical protein